MMPRVRGPIALRSRSGSSRKPLLSGQATSFGSAPLSWIIATKLTHAGVGTITSSPSSKRLAMMLYSAGLLPAEAIISAGS